MSVILNLVVKKKSPSHRRRPKYSVYTHSINKVKQISTNTNPTGPETKKEKEGKKFN